jgi:hypothetical protein
MAGWSQKTSAANYCRRHFIETGMNRSQARRFGSWLLTAMVIVVLQPNGITESIPVRYPEGTVHGFLVMRSEAGRVIASGDLLQSVRGNQVISRLIFHFKDGSIDDETTVFSQRGSFRLVSDHHIQRGPSFTHPIDLSIDPGNNKVTVRSTGKDGKEQVTTDHLDLPPDLVNGMVLLIIKNISPTASETKVSMLVATPRPRLVKLVITPDGKQPFSLAGSSRSALHFEIKIELGGIAGIVAPLIGKQPPDLQAWIVGGEVPTFVKEQGPFFVDGPIWTVELTSPIWPDAKGSGQ